MRFHGRGGEAALPFGDETLDRGVFGVGLEPVFRGETGDLGIVGRYGVAFVPDVPVVYVAVAPAVRRIESPARRGRRVPVGYGAAAKAVHHTGQDIPEDGFVYAVELFGLFFRIEFAEPAVAFVVGFPCYVYFVVAAPEDERRVVAQPAYVVFGFGPDVGVDLRRSGIHVAGEDEILPHHDAVPVAHFVEIVRLVRAAAPDAQHVHIGLGGAPHEKFRFLPRNPG